MILDNWVTAQTSGLKRTPELAKLTKASDFVESSERRGDKGAGRTHWDVQSREEALGIPGIGTWVALRARIPKVELTFVLAISFPAVPEHGVEKACEEVVSTRGGQEWPPILQLESK